MFRRLAHPLVAVLGLLLVVGVAGLGRRVLDPVPSDGIRWDPTARGLVARRVPASAAGILPGDRLLRVDGWRIGRAADLLLLDREARPGLLRTYEVEREGSLARAEVVVRPGGVPTSYLLLALAGLTALAGGLRLLHSADGEAGARPAALALAAFAALTLASPAGWMDAADRLQLVVDEAARIVFPALLLHAVVAVATRSSPRILGLLYAPAAALLAASTLYFGGGRRLDPEPLARLGAVLDGAAGVHLAAAALLAFGVAAWGWLRADRASRAPLARLLGCGVASVLPWAAASVLGRAGGRVEPVLADTALLTLPLLPLGIVGSFPAARLDPRELLRGGLRLGAGLLLGLGVVVATIELATELFPPLGLPSWLAYVAVGSVLAVGFFDRLRLALEGWLDSMLDREGYEARRTLLAFGRALAVETRVDALADALVLRVLRAFRTARAALYADTGGDRLELVGTRPVGAGSRPGVLEAAALADLAPAAGATIELDRPWAEPLRAAGFALGVPLVSRGRLCGLLVLGRPSGMGLGRRERRLLADLSGYVAVALDHSALLGRALRQAAEIRELEQFRLSVIESLATGLAIVDLEGRVLSTNRALRDLVGTAVERNARAEDVLPAVLLDPPPEGAEERRALGERVVAVSTRLLRRADGSVQGRILVAEDVTSRVAEEDERIRRERLATVGLLAAGVAHEINTPLAGIASYVQMLVEATAPGDPRRGLLEKVERQSFRAAGMVRSLLDFARSSDGAMEPFPIARAVTDAVGLLEHELRRARVKVDLDVEGCPEALGRAGEIEQVAVNLVKNAAEAMPDGGSLAVTAGGEGDEVWFRVADTGVGMPSEVRDRLFEPFFTTKERGRGHGLGLAVSQRIVESHGGRIEVESAPGRGTAVTVRLPAAVAARPRAAGGRRS